MGLLIALALMAVTGGIIIGVSGVAALQEILTTIMVALGVTATSAAATIVLDIAICVGIAAASMLAFTVMGAITGALTLCSLPQENMARSRAVQGYGALDEDEERAVPLESRNRKSKSKHDPEEVVKAVDDIYKTLIQGASDALKNKEDLWSQLDSSNANPAQLAATIKENISWRGKVLLPVGVEISESTGKIVISENKKMLTESEFMETVKAAFKLCERYCKEQQRMMPYVHKGLLSVAPAVTSDMAASSSSSNATFVPSQP